MILQSQECTKKTQMCTFEFTISVNEHLYSASGMIELPGDILCITSFLIKAFTLVSPPGVNGELDNG